MPPGGRLRCASTGSRPSRRRSAMRSRRRAFPSGRLCGARTPSSCRRRLGGGGARAARIRGRKDLSAKPVLHAPAPLSLPKPGRGGLLDMAAAPGGKTTQMAAMTGDRAHDYGLRKERHPRGAPAVQPAKAGRKARLCDADGCRAVGRPVFLRQGPAGRTVQRQRDDRPVAKQASPFRKSSWSIACRRSGNC